MHIWDTIRSLPFRVWIGITLLVVLSQALLLLLMGQPPLCECGYIKWWQGVVFSAENSQHLTDWYTFSHIIHGILFYALLKLIAPQLPIGLRLTLSILLEAGWELLENSDFIINRYRETALAENYFGDSVVNSVADTVSAIGGFFLAWKFPRTLTIALVIMMEVFVGYMIRDNLTLNVLTLIHPVESVSEWQARGGDR